MYFLKLYGDVAVIENSSRKANQSKQEVEEEDEEEEDEEEEEGNNNCLGLSNAPRVMVLHIKPHF